MAPDYLFLFSGLIVGFLAFFAAYLLRAWEIWTRSRVDAMDAWAELHGIVRRLDDSLDMLTERAALAERARNELQASTDMCMELSNDANELQKGIAKTVLALTEYASIHTKLVSAHYAEKHEPAPIEAPVRRKPGRPPKAAAQPPAPAPEPRDFTPEPEPVDTLTMPLDLGGPDSPKA